MTNRGTIIGTTEPQIQLYQPRMIVAGTAGPFTDPTLNGQGQNFQFGRYIALSPALVYAEIQMQFIPNAAGVWGGPGSGGVYCFSLPAEYPLLRPVPGTIDRTPLSPASGMSYLSIVAPYVNVESVPVPADPWPSLNGMEDRFFSCEVPYILDWGSFNVTGTVTTFTVPHKVGFAFAASDIDIKATGTAANTWWPVSVQNITATTFDIVSPSANLQTSVTWSWKVRAEPQAGQAAPLLSPIVPWDWATKVTALGPFGNFFFTLLYEPQS